MATEKPPAEEANTPAYVTAEELDAKLNAAITNHGKRQAASLTQSLGKLLEEKLAGFAPQTPEPKPADDVAAKLAALETQLKAERKAREDADKAREESENRRKMDEQRSAVSTALRDAGVNPTMAKAAQALLEAEGRIVRDDSGAVGFKVVDKYGGESVRPLGEGLGEWFKGDGKPFVPAKAAGGSGGSPSKAPAAAAGASKPKPTTPEDRSADAVQAARADLARALMGQPPADEE